MKKPNRPRIGKPRKQKQNVFTAAKYLSDPEYDQLHKKLIALKETNPRNAAYLLTALHTGARRSEILNLQFSDLILPNKISIQGLKNSNDREIPVPDWLFELLTSLPRDSENIFNFTPIRANQIWYGYRLVKKPLHSLRHTYAVKTFKRTRDLQLVKFAMGHRQIHNTLIYVNYVVTQEDTDRLL